MESNPVNTEILKNLELAILIYVKYGKIGKREHRDEMLKKCFPSPDFGTCEVVSLEEADE